MGRRAPLVDATFPVTPLSAAQEFCRQHRLGAPTLIRSGTNHVYRSGDVLLRVGAGDPAPQIVLLAHLKACSLDVLTPLDLARLQVGTWWVTAWPWLDSAAGAAIDGERLGATVRCLHDIPAATLTSLIPVPEYRLFRWLDVHGTLAGIQAARALEAPALAVLYAEAAALKNWWNDSVANGVVVCHGDVHPHNVLVSEHGQYLIDWDSICLGPRQLDHAALLTWETRWGGQSGLYESFARGYGGDFRNDKSAELLARFRNLVATVNMVARGIDNEALRSEAHVRLRWWLGDPNAPPWSAQ